MPIGCMVVWLIQLIFTKFEYTFKLANHNPGSINISASWIACHHKKLLCLHPKRSKWVWDRNLYIPYSFEGLKVLQISDTRTKFCGMTVCRNWQSWSYWINLISKFWILIRNNPKQRTKVPDLYQELTLHSVTLMIMYV